MYQAIVFLPLIGFLIVGLFGTALGAKASELITSGLLVISAVLSWVAFFSVGFSDVEVFTVPVLRWIQSGGIDAAWALRIDTLTVVMLVVVNTVSALVHIYSIGYMHHDPSRPRFFAYLSLFTFAMLMLVTSDNLIQMFFGWEGVGLASYLLIGFWYKKPSANAAAIKAFVVNRVGDFGFILGIFGVFVLFGSINLGTIFANAATYLPAEGAPESATVLNFLGYLLDKQAAMTIVCLLLFMGAMGKSAQVPLHTWLPDAMEGPTPVSAMIHAATMVSAGVYLVIRFFPLLSAGWEPGGALTAPMIAMGFIGAFTALFAATIALAQTDVKRVLAYSTISQLGYMIAALGVGAYAAAAFHLFTHAYFKALLFLGSGSIIHGMEHGVYHTGEHIDPQNMLNMGGLRKKMPVTFWTFLIGGLALSGFPIITAGFWSKDEILSGAFKGGQMGVFITLALAALLTAFYTARQITLVFLGQPRTKAADHAHESKWTMTLPLVILSVFAIGAGWAGIPADFPGLGGLIPNWFEEFVGSMVHIEYAEAGHSYIPLLTSLVVSLGGLTLGWLAYRGVKALVDPLEKPLGGLYTVLKNKYYVDEFYQTVFIRPALWVADVFTYKILDKTIIDGFLHGIARFGLWLGNLLRNSFDVPVVNGAGDNAARGTRGLGLLLHEKQSGRIQQYMAIAVSLLVLAILVIYFMVGKS